MPVSSSRRRRAERALYLDCSSGVSGDMLLAALLDLASSRAQLRALLNAVPLPGAKVTLARVQRGTITGLRCTVRSPRAVSSLHQLMARVRQSRLPQPAQRCALRILERLRRAEHQAHRGTRHAHRVYELGRYDTLLAVAGCAHLITQLRVRRVLVSPLPIGSGWIDAQEGVLPNPGPAVLELLKGFPLTLTKLPDELVTPTGAAIICAVARPLPEGCTLRAERIGYGVGGRKIPQLPGVLRACLGQLKA